MLRLLFLFTTIGFIACGDSTKREQETSIQLPAMCAPVTSDSAWYRSDNKAPLFEGMGDHHYPIQTALPLVQTYFNQGLVLAYGFNHAEAARSFYYAAKLDPECAMVYWGFAYVLGPNYNAGMEPDHYERAYVAIQKAKSLAEKSGIEKELDLINALATRYVSEPIEDRYPLDIQYADAMRVLYEKYPNDADIATLFAESLMNLHPWDLWSSDGEAKEWTPEIISLLEHIFTLSPKHPGAHHLYIHAVEASQTPNRGLASAQLFDEGLVPNSGHLVHMPSHIYIRTGDYHKGTVANINAVAVDSTYVTTCHAQGAYPLSYYPHNQHFLAATATLEGNQRWAIFAADAIANNANRQLMKEPGWGTIQHYYTIPFFVYVKFGLWDEILEMENDVSDLVYPEAILSYARGMAFLGKDQVMQAKEELNKLSRLAKDETLKELTIWDINSVYDIVTIAEKVLAAEILAHAEDYDQSIQILREAITIEDNLNYNEPPDWFFSVRHHLGDVQLTAKRMDEALLTYQEDLVRLPKNGWALSGLKSVYEGINHEENLKATDVKFQQAWATADIELSGSKVK